MAVVPVGTIIPWTQEAIPEGWHLCDGTDGTPDLQDRFVVCAGSTYVVGATGGGTGAGAVPSHTHDAGVDTQFQLDHEGNIRNHVHSGISMLDPVTPDAGTAGAGALPVSVGAAEEHTHAWDVVINLGDSHQHATSGTLGAVAAEASSVGYPPFTALYYIQRLS